MIPGVVDPYGVAIGWRREIAGVLSDLPGLRFVEVIAESLPCHGGGSRWRARWARSVARGRVPPALAALRERGVVVVPHGVRLSLGGAEPVDPTRVAHLAHCVHTLESPLASEHIAFVRGGGVEAGHLLPVPKTRDAVAVLAENVRRVRQELSAPLALEPIAALFDWPEDEFDEPEFVTRVLDATGAHLLLDVANVYANARNRGQDPVTMVSRFPLDRVAYLHVAGGAQWQGLYHDTHTAAVPAEVLDLISVVCDRCEPAAVMLERDGNYPSVTAIWGELDAIADAAGMPRITTRPIQHG